MFIYSSTDHYLQFNVETTSSSMRMEPENEMTATRPPTRVQGWQMTSKPLFSLFFFPFPIPHTKHHHPGPSRLQMQWGWFLVCFLYSCTITLHHLRTVSPRMRGGVVFAFSLYSCGCDIHITTTAAWLFEREIYFICICVPFTNSRKDEWKPIIVVIQIQMRW